MAENSNIEWTNHTFNPWWGCLKVSPACKHCYAHKLANRWTEHDLWKAGADRRTFSDKHWRGPVAWNRKAAVKNVRERVFCSSMADVFEDRRDLNEHRERLWELIDATPQLDWLLLTKRIELVNDIAPWGSEWPDNVWLGTTVENQKYANLRLPALASTGAKTKFLSCEPLLGAVSIAEWQESVDWVIAGGESGPGSRPMNQAWLESIKDECTEFGIPFFFKQWGNWFPIEGAELANYAKKEMKKVGEKTMVNVGKKKAGRSLHNEILQAFPLRSAYN